MNFTSPAMISAFLASVRRVGSAVLALGFLGTAVAAGEAERFGMDLSEKPDAQALGAFNVCVIRPGAKIDLEALHAVGTNCLAQIDLVEVPVGSAAAREAESLGVPLLESGKTGIVRMDPLHHGWLTVVARVL